jgi:hypothetical protein
MPTGLRTNGSTKRVVRQYKTAVYADATGESTALPVVPPAHLEDAGMSTDHGASYENLEHQGALAVDDEPAPTSPMSPDLYPMESIRCMADYMKKFQPCVLV